MQSVPGTRVLTLTEAGIRALVDLADKHPEGMTYTDEGVALFNVVQTLRASLEGETL